MPTNENSVETVVAEAVKAKVQTMMIEALGEPGELVKKLVAEALTQKVPTSDRYARPNQITLINKMVQEAVIDEGTKAMKEFILEQKDAIRAELMRHITTNKKNIAEALIDSLLTVAGSSYYLKLHFVEKNS